MAPNRKKIDIKSALRNENFFAQLAIQIDAFHKTKINIPNELDHDLLVLAITQAYRICQKNGVNVNIISENFEDTKAATEARDLIASHPEHYAKEAAKNIFEKIQDDNKRLREYFSHHIIRKGTYRIVTDLENIDTKNIIKQAIADLTSDRASTISIYVTPAPTTPSSDNPPPYKSTSSVNLSPRPASVIPTPSPPATTAAASSSPQHSKFIQLAEFIVGKTSKPDEKVANWVDRVQVAKDVNLADLKSQLVSLLVDKFEAHAQNPAFAAKLHQLIDNDKDNSKKKKFANHVFQELATNKKIQSTDFKYVGIIHGGSSFKSFAELLWGVIYAIIDKGKSFGKWWRSETEICVTNAQKFNDSIAEKSKENPIDVALEKINKHWLAV